jgi:HD-like signal output (HDOD) protein
MSVVTTALDAEKQLSAASLGGLVTDIPIPPRPAVVQQMQDEMGRPEPDMRRIGQIVGQDIGLTVAVLKTVNSPLYGLSRKAESVEQAVGLIGLKQLGILVTALSMRSLLKGDSSSLNQFHETSARRGQAMTRMAKATGLIDVTLAQTFGLFCDVGIPLLMSRFPTYTDTLKLAHEETKRTFTDVGNAAHHTDHALIGALMVRAWGLPNNVALAIRMHHDYQVFMDLKVPKEVIILIALNLVAEEAIHRHTHSQSNVEWTKGAEYVPGTLVMDPAEVEEWIEQLLDLFAHGLD